MVDFAGWSMPLVYGSIIEEHVWTRSRIGLFDVSHMGRIEVCGAKAGAALDGLCTRKVSEAEAGKTVYALMCNEDGGVLDDLMVSRLGEDSFYVVCNASNREKIVTHVREHAGETVEFRDVTESTGMVAVQGPKVVELIGRLLPGEVAELGHRRALRASMYGVSFIAFRGGYTGEDGFEAVFGPGAVVAVWRQLSGLAFNGERMVRPAGLGARDTLRLEAGLPLYGHELSERIDPISAGLRFAVDFEHDFVGRQALERVERDGPSRVRVGLRLDEKRAARQGHRILSDGQDIGEVTSGAYCPTVEASIAMGFVDRDRSAVGATVEVDTGKNRLAGRIVEIPFYRRPK